MIHKYKLGDYNIVLDVNSGGVHVVDELTYDMLDNVAPPFAPECPEEVVTKLSRFYDPEEVRSCYAEILEAYQEGILFSPDDYEKYANFAVASPIKAMCLNIAHDCNLRCKYCFASTGDFGEGRKLMSYETGKKAVDFLLQNSGDRVNLEMDFFGGEPLMNFPVVKRLVEYGRSIEKEKNKHFKFTMTTNCVLMNDEIMDFLNKEMSNVVISIDGRREVHDRMRPTINGKGSYDIIMNKAQEFVRRRNACDKEYYVRGTFTGFNKDFGNDVLHLADQGFDQISVEPVVTDPKCEYALREEDLPEIREEYERLAQIYMDRRANGKWFNFFHFMVDLEGGPCLRKRLTGCGAGNEYVAVTPDGDIYPCHQFVGRDGYRMGSVLDGTFDRDIQAKFAHNTVLNKEKCRDCWARFFCSGGCAANAEAFHGDISQPYDMECQMERKRLECAMAIYAKERAARMAKEEAEKE